MAGESVGIGKVDLKLGEFTGHGLDVPAVNDFCCFQQLILPELPAQPCWK